MAQTSANLTKAKVNKNDEFYTLFTDIEKELYHYKEHFKGKVVYCNTDDPTFSNFWTYFHLQFNFLGLKKLVATFYKEDGDVYKAEYTGEDDNDVTVYTKTPLEGNGDFRSDECLEILKEADIVVTNPPFSLFTEFVATLIEYNKKFIVWGNNNAVICKDIFPLFKSNKIWLGYLSNSTCKFRVGEGYKYDPKLTAEMNDGYHYGNVPAISTFTNLNIKKRHERLLLWRPYDELAYPKYDNYDAIEVGKVKDIPIDYEGVMAVPISYIGQHNPDQFEIVGLKDLNGHLNLTKKYVNLKIHTTDGKVKTEDTANSNAVLFCKVKPIGKNYYTADNVDGYLLATYARILIKKVLTK